MVVIEGSEGLVPGAIQARAAGRERRWAGERIQGER